MITSAFDMVDELLEGEHAERKVVERASADSVRVIWLFAFDCMR